MIFVICRLCGKSNGHLYGCAEAVPAPDRARLASTERSGE
jgi:hypothetical protein